MLRLTFFYWFSRFEFCLKENGYLKSSQPGMTTEAGWIAFVRKWGDQYVPSTEAHILLAPPPATQVVGKKLTEIRFVLTIVIGKRVTKHRKSPERIVTPVSATGHYVYLYRSKEGKALYVGYGAQAGRANAHRAGRSHNANLAKALTGNKGVSVEIVGPFGDRETALKVETVLISALRTEHNIHPGMSEWRFRPFGVPLEFVNRRETVLNYPTLRRTARQVGGVLLVYINARDFADGREGYDLAAPPSDGALLLRIDRWWQLAKSAAAWKTGRENGPRILLALSGPPRARFVVASCEIGSWKAWNSATHAVANGLIRVPVNPAAGLDALSLRGVKVDDSPSLAFGSFRHQQYIMLCENGERRGGVKSTQAGAANS